MNNALIGYTGFVGSNILEQHPFEELYNSKNFKDMEGKTFGDVVCAGISAVKWLANKNPEEDRRKIAELQDILSTINADRFILISTIDVYPNTSDGDEQFDCSSLPNNAYGTHRLEFEQFCISTFSNCYIIRLPGLFGKNLKKNVIFDLLNHNCLEMINQESSFQYYYLDNIWSDIEKTLTNNIRLINLFTAPVKTRTIIEKFFAHDTLDGLGTSPSPEAHYALTSCHASLWNGKNGYIYSEEQVLHQLGEFINKARNQPATP